MMFTQSQEPDYKLSKTDDGTRVQLVVQLPGEIKRVYLQDRASHGDQVFDTHIHTYTGYVRWC